MTSTEQQDRTPEFSLVMPCLNEAETLERCVTKARACLDRLGVDGEIVVADNGSEDGSSEIARRCGARLIPVGERGYGNALMAGIEAARGRYVIMGDADDSYDWSQLDGLIGKLREGHDLVMGCRFPKGGGRILPGAMPKTHRWFGNPVLSGLARVFFKCPVTDMYCGMRGFSADAVRRLDLRAKGMEFAYEMVIKATWAGLDIAEVPLTLHPDGRSGASHLRTIHDGWRTLRFMLIYSPKWLFMIPGMALLLLGLLGFALILPGPFWIGGVALDAHTLLVCSLALIIGLQCLCFGVFARIFAVTTGLVPEDPFFTRAVGYVKLETGLLAGLAFLVGGLGLLGAGVLFWARRGFGELPYAQGLRIVIPAITLLAIGTQVVFSSFFLSVLGFRRK